MEIELKRIGYNPRVDVNAFAANLFINGEKAAVITNKGSGTEYYPVDAQGAELVAQAEAHLKKQPGEKKVIDGKEQTVRNTLTDHIDRLFAEHLAGIERKKFDKKVDLMAKQNIVIGEPGVYMRTYPMKTHIDMLTSPAGREMLASTIATKILPTMRENETILNSNIPQDVLKKAGLKDVQYQHAEKPYDAKKTNKQAKGIKP